MYEPRVPFDIQRALLYAIEKCRHKNYFRSFPLRLHSLYQYDSWLSRIQIQEARIALLINLGPIMLVGTLETHFKIPLGTENLLTLHNLTV